MATKKTIKFEGHEFEYDADAFFDWRLQRDLIGKPGMAAVVRTSESLFEDPDAVAAELGNDIRKMDALVTACLHDMMEESEKVKN